MMMIHKHSLGTALRCGGNKKYPVPYDTFLEKGRVLNPMPGSLVCDFMPRILEIEMPGMGSCSRSAKWAWDRLGGGCDTPLLECRILYLHLGLVRTHIGSLLEPHVPALKECCVAASAQTIPRPFC